LCGLRDGKHPLKPARGGFLTRQFCIPATPSELRKVRRQVDDAASEFGLGPTDRYQFVFAVNEAVTNAIRHGSPAQDGTVGLRIDAEGDTLICSVYDSGRFVASQPRSEPLAETGRGFTLMALLMDQVELSTQPDGTTVRLHKRRQSEATNAG
jgi:anti-sigma regulatory factor (Ser/Thr protein kinase)